MTPAELRALRKSYDLTQQELADALGVYQQTIARWESDKREIPTYLGPALSYLGYRMLIARNEPIIQEHIVPMEIAREVMAALGITGSEPEIPMFDARGDVIGWRIVERGGVWAIGVNHRGGDACYIIPAEADPKPVIRLPDWVESGQGLPDPLRSSIHAHAR